MNFLVVSTGRTGTKFLAELLNQSPTWTVLHEPRGFRNDSYPKARHAFESDYYGEVNGALLKDYEKFDCTKAIIARDKNELLLSMANRYDLIELKNRINLFDHRQRLLDSYGGTVIDFKLMVSDLEYLKRVADFLGVKDVNITKRDMKATNETVVKTYKRIDELPQEILDLWNKKDSPQLIANL